MRIGLEAPKRAAVGEHPRHRVNGPHNLLRRIVAVEVPLRGVVQPLPLGQDEIDERQPICIRRIAPVGDELVLPVARVGKPDPQQLLSPSSEAVAPVAARSATQRKSDGSSHSGTPSTSTGYDASASGRFRR